MGKALFIEQLKAMGFQPEEIGDNGIFIPYTIPVGRLKGTEVKLGFEVNPTFPSIPPTGPHFSVQLLPLQAGGTHPTGGIHLSQQHGPSFTNDWQYWSRPFDGWEKTNRTVKVYMAHINNLLHTL